MGVGESGEETVTDDWRRDRVGKPNPRRGEKISDLSEKIRLCFEFYGGLPFLDIRTNIELIGEAGPRLSVQVPV